MHSNGLELGSESAVGGDERYAEGLRESHEFAIVSGTTGFNGQSHDLAGINIVPASAHEKFRFLGGAQSFGQGKGLLPDIQRKRISKFGTPQDGRSPLRILCECAFGVPGVITWD